MQGASPERLHLRRASTRQPAKPIRRREPGFAGPDGGGRTLYTPRENEEYEAFVRAHSARLIRSLSLIVLDRELAADAAQDAFLKLYLRWDTVGELKDPVAWVYKVALNRATDYRRRIARKLRLIERLQAQSYSDGWMAPEASSWALTAAFRNLPLGQRTAATLYYLADFSTEEAARMMNVSKGTVERHLNRARKTLRATLEVD